MDNDQIKSLINRQKDNYSLDQAFYTDETIFKVDLESIFFKQWVFIGHVSRIPNVGDYFLFNIGEVSILNYLEIHLMRLIKLKKKSLTLLHKTITNDHKRIYSFINNLCIYYY